IPVWVATRPIVAGAPIVPEDVRQETRAFDREPGRELLAGLAPASCTARHALVEGAVLKTTDLVRRPDVASGAPIALVAPARPGAPAARGARAAPPAVTVTATPRRSGNVGEMILVANPPTGEVAQAVVTGAGTAELVRTVGARRTRRGPAASPAEAPSSPVRP